MTDSIATDRRSLRSRRLLWEALLALLQKDDWAEISVQMICDRADVARSTFYAHFQTKQDLLEHLPEMTADNVPASQRLYLTTGGSTGVPVGFHLQRGVSRP